MRLGAAVFMAALAVFSGQQGAVAQTPDPIWREVAQVSYGDVHRRPPTAPLPPIDPDISAKWRAEIANAARNTSTTSFWDTFKSGGSGSLRNPVNMVKGAGRLIGAGGLFQVGAIGVNAAFNWLYNQANASTQFPGLYACMQHGLASGQQISTAMACDTKTTTTPYTFPFKAYPTNQTFIDWWRYYEVSSTGALVHDMYWQIRRQHTTDTGYYTIQASCRIGPTTYYSYNSSTNNVASVHTAYVNACKPPPKSVPDPISLTDWVEGVPSKNVEPHPAIKEEVKQAVVTYIENNYPNPGANGEVYPGMALEPAPSRSGWYGVPSNCTDDEDADQWADCEEILRESDPNDPTSKPNCQRDTDGDGVTDCSEDQANTDPYDPASSPDPDITVVKRTTRTVDNPDGSKSTITETTYSDGSKRKVTITVKTTTTQNPDGSWTRTTTTTTKEETFHPNGEPKAEPIERVQVEEEELPGEPVPAEDEAACLAAGGTWSGSTCTKKPDEKEPETPVANTCGDFSVARLLKHPGGYIKDVVFPCEPVGEIFAPLVASASTKWPFAMTASLGNVVSAPSAGDQSAVLPNTLGPFELDWSWLAPLVTMIGLLFKGAVSWIAIDLVLSRLMGQVVVK